MKEMATSAKFNSQTLTNYSAKKDLVQKIRNENVTQTGGNFFINNQKSQAKQYTHIYRMCY